MSFALIAFAVIVITYGISSLLPKKKSEVRSNRLRNAFGFDSVKDQATDLGLKFQLKHYIILMIISMVVGISIAFITDNLMFAVVGTVIGFFVPRLVFSKLKYSRRKAMLFNLPTNVRLLVSMMRDCKSLQKSLEMSLPVMSGVTKPLFENLYNSLLLGVDPRTALKQMSAKVQFRKFDDLCEKIIMGNIDGFHTKSIKSIKESNDDIKSDIALLQTIDVENRTKRNKFFVIFPAGWAIIFLFAYLEKNMESIGSSLTLLTTPGKILVGTLLLTTFFAYLGRDKYLRLNLDNL
ncbi:MULTISPECIES: type II secretion system F family protein [unclassified Paenibacillus]|uniref:type II secretion system F family protein n=1 Tax=unclassified Paenibacillus TaxID=185978 RepID=UPI0030F53CD1